MVNDTDYRQLNINADTMLENDYEPVMVNEQEGNNFDSYENNESVQEIFDTDINIEQSNNVWDDISIRYLIYCWSQLRDQFANCPDKNKKTLWEHVSERLVEHGFYFDAQTCDTKWRSLKKIYMYNKTRNSKKDNKHPVTWNHYSEMDKAIKGIPYEISDIENDDDNDDIDNNGQNEDDDDLTRENRDNIGEYENADSSRRYVDKCPWTIESTKELIRLYGKHRKKFSAANQGEKHLLWQDIAHQFSQLGYQYSANNCNDKWRNLKMTYKKNKQRSIKYGTEYIKWCYFKDMDNIFKNTPEGSPELNDIITVSLIDEDELDDIKKENEAYNSMHVVDETIENNEEEPIELPPIDIWTEQATKCLIELWGLYRPRFLLAPQGKKRLLWDEISNQLRQNGHNYSGLVCDRKWRLLKANYVKRREKYKQLGVNSVKWHYYHDLDRLLGVPAESISWSMDSTMCLIDCFDNHKEKFMNAATGEKLLIWKRISEEMAQNGFNYTPRACDNKWRTLKNRYNKNRMRTNRNKKVIWVYYNKIDSVLREPNKNVVRDESDNSDINNHSNEANELDEHNYIRTSKPSCYNKTNCITELQTMFRLRNKEFDERLKEMEENLNSREKVFEGLQQQMLEHLKRSNELETQKLRLLEQLVSRLPLHIP